MSDDAAPNGMHAAVDQVPPGPSHGSGAIGVALSGGGVRAALFSVGVLVGLVHLGTNRRVTQIASVSGGSITNAAVAQTCPYAECASIDDLAAVAGPLAGVLSRRGAFVWSRAAVWDLVRFGVPRLFSVLLTLLPLSVAVLALLDGLVEGSPSPSIDVGSINWIPVAAIALAAIGAGLFLARGWLQEAFYSATLASLPDASTNRTLRQFVGSTSTTHVLVATDLVSSRPVYFSRDFVACPAFGWGTPGNFRTAGAVYASAAFPVVFPLRRIRRKRFAFRGGDSSPPYPRLLKLTDGGVFNNLGTDWFAELASQEGDTMWKFGNLALKNPMAPVSRQVIVNAGAATRGLSRVPPFMAIPRTMSVLYDNTVQPRLENIRAAASRGEVAPIVVDIVESPYHLARRLAVSRQATAEQQERADRARVLADRLGQQGRDNDFWTAFARQTSKTRTKLTRAGLEAGARIMLHGYLSTIVALHVLEAVPLPDRVLGEDYFLDLAGRDGQVSGAAEGEHASAVAAEV